MPSVTSYNVANIVISDSRILGKEGERFVSRDVSIMDESGNVDFRVTCFGAFQCGGDPAVPGVKVDCEETGNRVLIAADPVNPPAIAALEGDGIVTVKEVNDFAEWARELVFILKKAVDRTDDCGAGLASFANGLEALLDSHESYVVR